MSVSFPLPDAKELLANAKANVAGIPESHHLASLLRRLADKSDQRYFGAICDAAFSLDPVLLRQPIVLPPGDGWRRTIDERRKERLRPFLRDIRQVAEYHHRGWRLIFRIAGLPRRYKYNAMLCSRFARDALKIVSNPEFGCLHAFFERFIEPGGGWEQPSLRAALREAFPGLYLDSLIQGLCISHPVGLADLVILKRIGIVVEENCQHKAPSRSECQQAVQFYRDIARATGQTFEYVAAVFRASFAWSRFDARSISICRAAVCLAYGPKCEVCSHASYCQKRGLEAFTSDRESGWLSLYPEFRDHLFNLRSTLEQLPCSATEAVLSCLRFETAIHERSEFILLDTERLKPVRAALVPLPATVLQEAWKRWANGQFPGEDSTRLTRRDYPAEFWPVASLADSELPCVLELPPFQFFAGHGDALLAEYIRRGEVTVPLLAVDWEQVAEVIVGMGSDSVELEGCVAMDCAATNGRPGCKSSSLDSV